MKLTFAALFLTMSISAFCQDEYKDVLPTLNGKVVYIDSVSTPNVSKSEVFRRARRWFVLMYKNPDKVLILNEESTGELIARGFGEAITPDKKKIDQLHVYLHTETQFDARDNGYKIRIGNLILQSSMIATKDPVEEYRRYPKKNLIRTLEACNVAIRRDMASLTKYILTEEFDQ